MSIMPRGGWLPEEPAVLPPPHQSQLAPFDRAERCPSCNSDDWKLASLVYMEGLTNSRFRTKGRSVSVARNGLRNGHFSVGTAAYSGAVTGRSQTALSQIAAPPQKPRALFNLLTIALVISLSYLYGDYTRNDMQGLVVTAPLTGLLLIILLSVRSRQTKAYEEEMDDYASRKMCQRCGSFFG
jgi:hypothetical protein